MLGCPSDPLPCPPIDTLHITQDPATSTTSTDRSRGITEWYLTRRDPVVRIWNNRERSTDL
jgi:hypothetical protein